MKRILSLLKFKRHGNIGIAGMLSGIFSLALVVTLVTIGVYSLRTIFKTKYQDVVGLLFADAERLGYEIKLDLAEAAPKADGKSQPDGLLRLNPDGTLSTLVGPWTDSLSLDHLKLDREFFTGDPAKDYVLRIGGLNFLASSIQIENASDIHRLEAIPLSDPVPASYLVLWKLPESVLRVDQSNSDSAGTRVYVISREGQLLYGNDGRITQANFITRPLVQSFFTSPISQGYLATDDGTGSQIYGAYYELPNSNLVIFAETYQSDALAAIYETIRNSGAIFIVILILAVLALQFPLRNIILPIKDLAALTEQVAAGNFKGRAIERGQGELHVLTKGFNQMCQSLVDRDDSIRDLRIQELEKIALKLEMDIARNIQNNFLPAKAKQEIGSLQVNSIYIPASMCAGDWFNIHHAEGKTLFVIADVSGHGVGSSMYTAMIAGIFNLFIARPAAAWVLQDFISEVNTVIFNLGRRQWHVTMIVGIYREGELEIMNAGHTHPVLHYPKDSKIAAKRLTLAANPLGLEPVPTAKTLTIPFPSGSSIVLYTDGLTETTDPKGVQWGTRKLSKLVTDHEGRHEMLDEIITVWNQHRQNAILQDDVCVLTLRAV